MTQPTGGSSRYSGHPCTSSEDWVLRRRLGGATDDRPRGEKKPTGGRDLREVELPDERIEIIDATLEAATRTVGGAEDFEAQLGRSMASLLESGEVLFDLCCRSAGLLVHPDSGGFDLE